MSAFQDDMREYKQQMAKGAIQRAYKGLMEYMLALRAHFEKRHPEFTVPGGLYFGYMDMTYFAVIPAALKERQLKFAIVFIHETCRFEIWLSAVNKTVQAQTWKIVKESGWDKYHLLPDLKGMDAIVDHVLVADPDFSDLDGLTQKIENGTLEFIRDVEEFLKNKGTLPVQKM